MAKHSYQPTPRTIDVHTAMPVLREAVAGRDPELPPLPLFVETRTGQEGVSAPARFLRDWHVGLGVAVGLAAVISDAQFLDDPAMTGTVAFLILIFFPLLIGAAVSLVAGGVGKALARSGHRQWRAAEQARIQAYNDHAWQQWVATRPLYQVATSPAPRQTLRELMAAEGASIYLGVMPDTQTMATAGRQASVLVLAPSQCGKTTTLAAPMVLSHDGPAVLTSTKEDLVDFTAAQRGRQGTVWIYDPAGAWEDKLPPGARLAHWSPLSGITDWDSALVTAATMIGATSLGRSGRDDHWVDMAQNVLAPCLLAGALHQDATMADVTNWVLERYFPVPNELLTQVLADPSHPCHDDAALALRQLQSALRTTGDQYDAVMTSAARVLGAYNTKAGRRSSGLQTFDPATFARSSDTLYIASPSKHQATFAPLIVALLDAIVQAGYEHNRARPFHSSARPSLLMCLDEAANISPMRDLPRYLSEASGQGVQMVIFLQSLGQAQQIWPAQADSFLDLFATVMAFGGLSDHKTLEALSVMAGDFDRVYVSNTFSATTSSSISDSKGDSWAFLEVTHHSSNTGQSQSNSTTRGSSQSVRKERRLSPADIASLPPRHTLLISKLDRRRRSPAVIAEMTAVYEQPWTSVRESSHGVIDLRARIPSQATAHSFPLLPGLSELEKAAAARASKTQKAT